MSALQAASPPPPGTVANLEHPDTSLNTINTITQVLVLSIVSLLVLLRLFTRAFVVPNFGSDDWTCLLAWIGAVGYFSLALIMGTHGGGIHTWEIPEGQLVPFVKSVYATMLVYGPTALFTKASILLFLSRVFKPLESANRTIHIFIALMVAYYVPILFLKGFICRPITKFWDPSVEGKCFNQRALILADAVISVISDFVVLLLPVPFTMKLQMPGKRKLRIAVLFSAGGVACVCSIVRLIDIALHGQSPDATYVFTRVNLWGIAEIAIGLICACIPVLPVLFKRILGIGTTQSYTPNSKNYEMATAMSRRRTNIKLTSVGGGSDENVLISAHPRLETRVHAMDSGGQHDMAEQGIVRTIEVTQAVSE